MNKNLINISKDEPISYSTADKSLFWYCALLWTMLVALGWGSEEPSKIQTIVVVFIVFILAILIIRYAKNKGIIASQKLWISIFLIKLTFVAIIIQYLWIPAFSNHRMLFEFDPVVFDYYGKILAESNFDISLISQVYNYVGQIYYIGAIYWLFGVSTFYIGVFNTLLSLITFLAVTALLIELSENNKYLKLFGLGMLFPELLYYDAIPGKEVIATCMIALSILFMYRILIKGKIKYVPIFLVILAILTSVRASMVIVVVLIGSIWIIMKRRQYIKSVFLYGSIVLVTLLFLFPYSSKYIGSHPINISDLLSLSNKAEFGIEYTLGEKSLNVMFTTSDPIKAIIFAPIRTIFLLVAPFPRLIIDFNDRAFLLDFVKLSLWLVLLFFPILLASTFQKNCRRSKPWFYIVVTYWLLMLFIANGVLMIHERYRVMAEPFLFGSLLIGIKYGNPKKYILPSFLLFFLGFVAYYILKYFA